MSYYTLDTSMKLEELLIKAKKYVQIAHDDAESKHDNYGEFYMGYDQYEIIQQTEELIKEINQYMEIINK